MLGFDSLSCSEIQVISRDCVVYNTKEMGAQPSCPPHAPCAQQLSCPGHGPFPKPFSLTPCSTVPAGSCRDIIPLFSRWLADHFRFSRYN